MIRICFEQLEHPMALWRRCGFQLGRSSSTRRKTVAGTAAAFKVLWCRWWEVWEKCRKMMEHESWFNVRRSTLINNIPSSCTIISPGFQDLDFSLVDSCCRTAIGRR